MNVSGKMRAEEKLLDMGIFPICHIVYAVVCVKTQHVVCSKS